jgi:hypothetical protein
MQAFVSLLVLSIGCSAQALQSFDEQHIRGIKENPPGITLTIATADGGSTYHRAETIRMKLMFASKLLRRKSREL